MNIVIETSTNIVKYAGESGLPEKSEDVRLEKLLLKR